MLFEVVDSEKPSGAVNVVRLERDAEETTVGEDGLRGRTVVGRDILGLNRVEEVYGTFESDTTQSRHLAVGEINIEVGQFDVVAERFSVASKKG